MNADKGNFTATLFPTVTGSYAGSFESTGSAAPSNVTMSMSTDWNFNITGTITPGTGASVCFSNMTINTPPAATYGPSFASGDVLEAVASDTKGNVVAFIASNTNANQIPLTGGNLFVTYVGLAGACQGVSGVDVPFKKILMHSRGGAPLFSSPQAPPHAAVHHFGTESQFRFAQFLKQQQPPQKQPEKTVRPAPQPIERRVPEAVERQTPQR
jgi:hypothetical protein